MGSDNGVLCQKLASLIHAVSIYLLLPFFRFISTYILRLQRYKEPVFLEAEAESKPVKIAAEFRDNYANKEEKSELHLKFKFPTFEESIIQKGKGNFLVPSESTCKYEFASGQKSLSAFNDEKLENFPLKEINVSRTGNFSENEEVFLHRRFVKVCEDTGGKETVIGEENEKTEAIEFTEKPEKKAQSVQEEEEFHGNQEFLDESQLCSEKNSDGFLSDGDFIGGFNIDSQNEKTGLDVKNSDFLSEKDFNENLDNKNDAEYVPKDDMGLKSGDNSEKLKPKDTSSMSDSGDANKLESLWEHQELIEQLKMELKKVRATGLPTILEESESPKIMDDLKPWKIDEKFQHEDCMDELHKFYKSYNEMMRKFDILNYQKMYAMGFLQLKDPFQSTTQQKPSAPTFKSLVSQNLWLFKHKSRGSDPIKKFINELQGDLEVVYVGQMCLSWEFLHWQYEKALDLWNSDPHGIHRYNEVAGEFQQFQVLMQRFIEDEPFQGPRVQNYVKSRCVLRNLLQVPVIREDNLKGRKKARRKDKDEYVVTSDMLVEIVEESIRIFWRFVRSDKDCNTLAINSHKKMPEFHSPEDLKLPAEVRKILQKKERKLKDILRSENCILRKFRQSREDDSDQVLYFFAQVDMKLVIRVLNMSKITREQLIWCQNKLSKISFLNRKIYVEPSFLLFPC